MSASLKLVRVTPHKPSRTVLIELLEPGVEHALTFSVEDGMLRCVGIHGPVLCSPDQKLTVYVEALP